MPRGQLSALALLSLFATSAVSAMKSNGGGIVIDGIAQAADLPKPLNGPTIGDDSLPEYDKPAKQLIADLQQANKLLDLSLQQVDSVTVVNPKAFAEVCKTCASDPAAPSRFIFKASKLFLDELCFAPFRLGTGNVEADCKTQLIRNLPYMALQKLFTAKPNYRLNAQDVKKIEAAFSQLQLAATRFLSGTKSKRTQVLNELAALFPSDFTFTLRVTNASKQLLAIESDDDFRSRLTPQGGMKVPFPGTLFGKAFKATAIASEVNDKTFQLRFENNIYNVIYLLHQCFNEASSAVTVPSVLVKSSALTRDPRLQALLSHPLVKEVIDTQNKLIRKLAKQANKPSAQATTEPAPNAAKPMRPQAM